MIPENIIICKFNDNTDIFKNKQLYKTNNKISYIADGRLFSPPFYKLIVLFDTVNIVEDDLKKLWNMTILEGFLVIPKNIFNKFDFTKKLKNIKLFKNYVMIHKKNNIIHIADNVWRRAIDFGIYGCQKGGTSAALYNMRKHPDLSMFEHEIHYVDTHLYKGENWFRKHFNYKKKYVGEKNPDLLYLDEYHQIMQTINPFLKIIILLRNPIDRAFSEYKMLLKDTWTDQWDNSKTFEDLIEEELKYRTEEPKNLYNSTFHLLQRGLYFKQIQKLLKYFPRQNILILMSENTKNNMTDEYNKIYDFLGVKKLYDIEYEFRHVGNYNDKIHKNTYEKLINYFKDDVTKLEKFLGYKTNWFK